LGQPYRSLGGTSERREPRVRTAAEGRSADRFDRCNTMAPDLLFWVHERGEDVIRLSSRRAARAVPPRWRLGLVSAPNRLFALADHLVADGKAVDALRLLTRANLRRRDARIAQRIVELRFDAFAQMAPFGGRPSWPDEIPDLFPAARLPEVASADLTAERLRSAIVHQAH
jgi:hypothetical protein